MKPDAIRLLKEAIQQIVDTEMPDTWDGAKQHISLFAGRALRLVKHLETDQDHYTRIYETGLYYGYPKCCIEEYGADSVESNHGRIGHRNQISGGNKKQFCPCTSHAIEIQAGLITLESLIVNRVCKDPF